MSFNVGFQGSLAVEEGRLARAIEKLHLYQTNLDDEQTELDVVQAEYDVAMQRRQVRD